MTVSLRAVFQVNRGQWSWPLLTFWRFPDISFPYWTLSFWNVDTHQESPSKHTHTHTHHTHKFLLFRHDTTCYDLSCRAVWLVSYRDNMGLMAAIAASTRLETSYAELLIWMAGAFGGKSRLPDWAECRQLGYCCQIIIIRNLYSPIMPFGGYRGAIVTIMALIARIVAALYTVHYIRIFKGKDI